MSSPYTTQPGSEIAETQYYGSDIPAQQPFPSSPPDNTQPMITVHDFGRGIEIIDITEEDEDEDDTLTGNPYLPPDLWNLSSELPHPSESGTPPRSTAPQSDHPWINDGLPSYPSMQGHWRYITGNQNPFSLNMPLDADIDFNFIHSPITGNDDVYQKIATFTCKSPPPIPSPL